jgi:hypothetical protein
MTNNSYSLELSTMSAKLERLYLALDRGASRARCLRLWSEFIRERDGHRCLDCHSRNNLSAHHICRKCFVAGAQYDTGNGITLCKTCHRELHVGFNGRPSTSLPVDWQGGEKLAYMARLYSILVDDAVDRGLVGDDFYFVSDQLLTTFKTMQGYEQSTDFPGSRVEQAYLVLAESENPMRRALAEADGFPMTNEPLLPGGMYLVFDDKGPDLPHSQIVHNYVPRTNCGFLASVLRADQPTTALASQ